MKAAVVSLLKKGNDISSPYRHDRIKTPPAYYCG
jgi:hypothetical protein